MFTGDFGYPVVYQFSLFRIRKSRIRVSTSATCVSVYSEVSSHLIWIMVRCIFYAEKIFRLAGNGDRSPECDDTVDIRHGRLAYIRVAVPCSAVLPSKTVCRLAVLHDGGDAVIVIRRHAVVVCGIRLCLGIVGLFLLPLREFSFQTVYPCLVRVVLLPVSRRILNARRTDFLQQDSVLVFNAPICASILAAWLFASFNSASSSERSRSFSVTEVCMAHSLVWAFNELPHLRHLYCVEPCPSVTPVGTGHADGHALASLQFGCVRCLVIVPRTGRYIIGVAVLVLVELRKPDIQLRPKRVQVHRVGIEDFLIDDLFFVPVFAHMDFVCVCLLVCLFFLLMI